MIIENFHISEQNYLDKPGFNDVNRCNHSFPMNNTVTIKIKHVPQLLALTPQISLKQK